MKNFFSSNLKYLRESRHMSKSELAKKLNVHQSTVSRWENDEMGATIDNAIDISNILNIPLPDLLGIDLKNENNKLKNTKTTKFGDVEITISKNGKITDKDMLELNQYLIKEKIANENTEN